MAHTPSRIHFVSRYSQRDERGYNDLGGGIFTTEAWAVSADAANSVQEVWLHDRKDDTAWRGGKVIDKEAVPGKSGRARWRFKIQEIRTSGVAWPGPRGGGPEKAYV